jgi:RNA polymerase sigma-70 factor (ECF subfamily)
VHFLYLDRKDEDQNPDCEQAAQVSIADDSANPYDKVVKSELAEKVRKIIAFLPAGQRAVLVLSYYQQMSFSEVAKVMGCSVGAVKRQMYRALKKLADKLPERYGAL